MVIQEYKKSNKTVSREVKLKLAGAVKEPSEFIRDFLKSDGQLVAQTMQDTYDKIYARFLIDDDFDDSKKAKYAGKQETSRHNFKQLTDEPLKASFNKDDFIKSGFLQYMLYAYLVCRGFSTRLLERIGYTQMLLG